MARLYHIRPSEILKVQDEYTAYCLDQACAYITGMIQDGEKPNFNALKKTTQQSVKHYDSLRDMYEDLGFEYGAYVKQIE